MLKKRFRYNIMISPTPFISTLHTFFPLSTFFIGELSSYISTCFGDDPPPKKKKIHFTSQKNAWTRPPKMLVRGSLNGAKRHIYTHKNKPKPQKQSSFERRLGLSWFACSLVWEACCHVSPPFSYIFSFGDCSARFYSCFMSNLQKIVAFLSKIFS